MNRICCPVCWGPLTDASTGCTSCQTPHHADCFTWMGGCAVFGCGGKQCGAVQNVSNESPLHLSDEPAAAPPPSGPRALPRSATQRYSAAWTCLMKNARVGALLACIAMGLAAAACLLLNVYPTEADTQLLVTMKLAPEGVKSLPAYRHMSAAQVAELEELKRRLPDGPRFWIGLGVLLAHDLPFMWMFLSLVMYVLMTARARGKELESCELLSLASSRLWRTITVSIRVFLLVMFWSIAFFAGSAFCAGLLFAVAPVAGVIIGLPLVIYAALCWFRKVVDMQLAPVIAAMSPEDEPGDPVARSAELVSPHRSHVMWATFVAGFLTNMTILIAMLAGGGVLALAGVSGLTMAIAQLIFGGFAVFVMFTLPLTQFLLYVEARRHQEAGFMKFAPTEIPGGPGRPA